MKATQAWNIFNFKHMMSKYNKPAQKCCLFIFHVKKPRSAQGGREIPLERDLWFLLVAKAVTECKCKMFYSATRWFFVDPTCFALSEAEKR